MSVPDEDVVTVVGVVASTHQMPGRVIRVAREALESAQEQLLAGYKFYRIDHDERNAISPTVIDAEVRREVDGEFSLVVTMSMSQSDYEKLGTRRAFSIAFPEMGIPGWQSPDHADVVMLADSYHWDDAAILEALESYLGAEFPVDGGRYHQLAGEPPAKIIFELLANYKDVPPAVLAAYMVEGIKVLLRRRRKDSDGQTLDDTATPSPDVDSSDALPGPGEQVSVEIPDQAPAEVVASDDEGDGSAALPSAKVTLEFRNDVRRVAVDCNASASSAQLIETVIRALAEVTPISDEQNDVPPSV